MKKKEEKQIYKFTYEEVKELTYNQVKILSVIRQFSIDNVSKIYTSEIVKRTRLANSTVSLALKELYNKHYLAKEDKEYIILKPVEKGKQYLYWTDDDLLLGLTYNQFVLYCLIRTNSNKFGYAMLKYSTISNLTGIADTHISRAIKQLIEKELIFAEKMKTYTKYVIIEKSKYEEYIDNSDNEKSETAENVEELPKEIQQIVAEDKKEQTIYDKVASIFKWDKLPKNGIKAIDQCISEYNDARVDIGNIIYGIIKQTKYKININKKFPNNAAEFGYWWTCAEKEITETYKSQVWQQNELEMHSRMEALEEETPKAKYVSQPEKYVDDELMEEYW